MGVAQNEALTKALTKAVGTVSNRITAARKKVLAMLEAAPSDENRAPLAELDNDLIDAESAILDTFDALNCWSEEVV